MQVGKLVGIGLKTFSINSLANIQNYAQLIFEFQLDLSSFRFTETPSKSFFFNFCSALLITNFNWVPITKTSFPFFCDIKV